MQEGLTDFSAVPIVEVGTDNIQQIWPSMLLAVKSATFVAMDLELSGLGDRRKINARSMDDRYSAMCDVAKTRSILSIGLSSFRLLSTSESAAPAGPAAHQETQAPSFSVQTFNILALCSENYVVEPQSLKFLVDHGFDFNKQYATGLPYYRGSDKAEENPTLCLRQLFAELVTSSVPVLFHNAFVDLVFLYHNLYTNLPVQMSCFLADLSEIFAGGLYDTKYITEFKARMPASYLSYVFRKCQRENHSCNKSGQPRVRVAFLSYPSTVPGIIHMPCGLDTIPSSQTRESAETPNICRHYASHGWCQKASACPSSHNIDHILNNEALGSSSKRRRKRQHHESCREPSKSGSQGGEENRETDTVDFTRDGEDGEQPVKSSSSIQTLVDNAVKCEKNFAMVGHRAGFDAFMTGFTFAVYLAKFGKPAAGTEKLSEMGMEAFRNRVSLSGKDIPLHVVKSNFAKTSREHREKIERLRPVIDAS